MNVSKTQKVKFTHDNSKILFFETFLYNNINYYITQCQSRNVFIGKVQEGKFGLQWKSPIKEKIKCFCVGWKSDIIWVATFSGNIIGLDFINSDGLGQSKGEQDSSKIYNFNISEVDKRGIVGLIAYNTQNQQRVVVSFSQYGKIKKYINEQLKQQVQIQHQIYKFRNNSWCAFMIKKKYFPIILNLQTILRIVSSQIPFQRYLESIQYQDEEFKNQTPLHLCLSDQHSILILGYSKKISVCIIQKHENTLKAYIDYQVSLKQQNLSGIDLFGSYLAFSTQTSITMYDVINRHKISKTMTVKTVKHHYNMIFWAKPKQYLLYGYQQNQKSKIMFHNVKGITND